MPETLTQRLHAHLRGDATVYNSFEITNAAELTWEVRAYQVTKLDKPAGAKEHRKMENVIWKLREQHLDTCPGASFVVTLDDETVLVAQTWSLPEQQSFMGYHVKPAGNMTLSAQDPRHRIAVREVIKRSLRNHLKANYQEELGPLWQDFGGFCESPSLKLPTGNVAFCRRFEIVPEVLAGGRWVLKVDLSTHGVDARSLTEYYFAGEVETLETYIRLKRTNRLNRSQSSATAIRALELRKGTSDYRVRDLVQTEVFEAHAKLPLTSQRELAVGTALCSNFPARDAAIPLANLRLILDTQITGEEHRETILDPDIRDDWYNRVRSAVDGANLHGVVIALAPDLVTVPEARQLTIAPPALHLMTDERTVGTLPAPEAATADALRKRANERNRKVRQFGFLKTRPISPLLAWPQTFPKERAERMLKDLNQLVREQGAPVTIGGPLMYGSELDIAREVERAGYDSVIAILPEGSRRPQHGQDTHERIKKTLQVESQCIHHDKTLHPRWLKTSWNEIEKRDRYWARSAQSNYQAVLLNLLVKHSWLPFFPAEPFAFNVHVGIDVGGIHNSVAAVCVGYGLADGRPVFLPEKLEFSAPQADPIHPDVLAAGLLGVFRRIAKPFTDRGYAPNFERLLFFRDGDLKGQGEAWHESEAFELLFKELRAEGLVSDEAIWVAVEVSKRATLLKQFSQTDGRLTNPIIGQVTFPYDDEYVALVSTTGEPYLGQGTASPLLVRMQSVKGRFDRLDVLRDLIWEADMCFTKLDTGMSLPFVLHVADKGALQTSRLYNYTGITV